MLLHITLLNKLRGKGEAVPLRHKIMCWSGGRAPDILNFGARQSWVVIATPDHLTPENLRMDVPQPVWTFRRLAESVSAAVNPVASSRGLSHCLSHCAYSHCREKLYLHAFVRLRDVRRQPHCVYVLVPATSELSCRKCGPQDRQSAAQLCGSGLYSAVGCTLSGLLACTVPIAVVPTSTNTNFTIGTALYLIVKFV